MITLIKTGRYRHYKGAEYQVVGTARHSETEEVLVLYYPLYGDTASQEYWVRPLAMFMEAVTVAGGEQPRFAFIAD